MSGFGSSREDGRGGAFASSSFVVFAGFGIARGSEGRRTDRLDAFVRVPLAPS
jgi:hypothetical protein